MADLTPTIHEKMHALRVLRKLYAVGTPETPEEITRRWDECDGCARVAAAIWVLADPAAGWVRKVAATEVVDWFIPGFKRSGRPELLGSIMDRGHPRVQKWRRACLERDGFACRECGAVADLHVHHVQPWAKAPWARIVVANGVTLCARCHGRAHGQVAA